MDRTNYGVERVLQLVRASFNEQMGDLSYKGFLQRLWKRLESLNDPGVVKPAPHESHFAAAVMVGAASEKAVYLLAASLLSASKPSHRRATLETALTKRRLFELLDCVRKTIEDSSKGNSAPIPYSVSESTTPHLASLFEAIRTQRNDAVHPMNATVSPSSVRLLLCSFPYALETTEKLRAWLDANPATL